MADKDDLPHYKKIPMGSEYTLWYSRHENSLPVTTIKVENEPCMGQPDASVSPGTVLLPQELM